MILNSLNGYLYNPYGVVFKHLHMIRQRTFDTKQKFKFPFDPYFIASEEWSETVNAYMPFVDQYGHTFEKPYSTILEVKHLFISAN